MMNIKSGKYNTKIPVSQGRSLTLVKGSGVALTICWWSNKIFKKEYAWAPKTYNFQWTDDKIHCSFYVFESKT